MSGRKQRTRELRHGKILIVGEGATEKCYFENLKAIYGYRCCVQPRFYRNTAIKDIRKIIGKYSEEPITLVVVTDMDSVKRDKKVGKDWEALKKDYKNNKNILFCESNPCLEYWFLLHFADTCRNFSSNEVKRELRKYIKNYQKKNKFLESEKWVREMSYQKGSLKEAQKKAKKYINGSSYSKVYRAIEELEKTK